MGTSSTNFSLQQGAPALPWPCNVALREDALTLLRALPNGCTPLVFFDPQHRSTLNRLRYGNEGARQRERCALPQMSDDYIDECCRQTARVLQPSGYLFLWVDTFRLCQGDHLRIKDVLPCVAAIAWSGGSGVALAPAALGLVAASLDLAEGRNPERSRSEVQPSRSERNRNAVSRSQSQAAMTKSSGV